MNRLRTIFAVLVSGGGLVACQAPEIRLTIISEAGRYVIKLDQAWGFPFRRYEVPCVQSLVVSRGSGSFDDWRNPIWKLTAPAGKQCLKLASITLGDVPKGFSQSEPLPTGLRGSYYLLVTGIGDGRLKVNLDQLPPVRYSVEAI